MKCLRKYKWVKLPRMHLPGGKGLMGYWAKLASRAAFRKGNAVYCGHINPVTAGMWSGGVVGLKSILGVKKRVKALWIMNQLQDLGYISYSLDPKTKQLTYQINDWVLKCSGAECKDGAVYATEGYGFLCMPRNITERLVGKRTFEEADAWLDLWCHTTYGDYGNAFSFLGPAIQYGKYGSVLTLDNLGNRFFEILDRCVDEAVKGYYRLVLVRPLHSTRSTAHVRISFAMCLLSRRSMQSFILQPIKQ